MDRSFFALLLLSGCSTAPPDEPVIGGGEDTAAIDTSTIDTAAQDTAQNTEGCHATPAAAERDRLVLVSHPYRGEGGSASPRWEVLRLSPLGALSVTGSFFEMGTTTGGSMAFTPDGELGLIVQKDGSVGIVQLQNGVVTVLNAGWASPDFYAESLTIAPDGRTVWFNNPNWVESGGGLYRATLGCDGALSVPEKIFEIKQPSAPVLSVDGTQAFVAGRAIAGQPEGHNAFVLDLDGGTVLSSAPAFSDDLAIFSGVAWLPSAGLGLVGDQSEFNGIPTRLGFVGFSGDQVSAVGAMDLPDPSYFLVSPDEDAVLISSSYEDAVFVLNPSGGSFSNRGEPTYVGASPQLPKAAVMVRVGGLRGHVLLAENMGVRQLEFDGAGGVKDLGLVTLHGGFEGIVGAIGVQP